MTESKKGQIRLSILNQEYLGGTNYRVANRYQLLTENIWIFAKFGVKLNLKFEAASAWRATITELRRRCQQTTWKVTEYCKTLVAGKNPFLSNANKTVWVKQKSGCSYLLVHLDVQPIWHFIVLGKQRERIRGQTFWGARNETGAGTHHHVVPLHLRLLAGQFLALQFQAATRKNRCVSDYR